MIKTGDKYRHEVTYTQEGVIAFAEITGDKNPIHASYNLYTIHVGT